MSRRRAFLKLEALEGRCVPSTVTNLNDSGSGSLRDAIEITPPGGTVDFQPGLTGTITLTTGQLEVFKDLSILSASPDQIVVSGSSVSRVFFTAANVNLAGIRIMNGRSTDSGGGIYNSGVLKVTNCILMNNTAAGMGSNGGGAIFNAGIITIQGSRLINNVALGGQGANGVHGGGGGLYNSLTATIIDSVIAVNSAAGQRGFGGGAYNRGTMNVLRSSVSGNSASATFGGGGGFLNSGRLIIEYSTISRNSTFASGGGILNYDPDEQQDTYLIVSNTTIAGNRSPGDGAGVFAALTPTTVTDSTISRNSALISAGGVQGTDVTIRNSVIAGNSAPVRPDIEATFTSLGHNLIGDGTGGTGYDPTDLVGTSGSPIDPKLGPLQDNGGPTFTMALLPGSPAIDAGDNTDAPTWDQRGPGYPRIVNGTIDIGAFEVQASGVSVPGSRTPFGNPIVETLFRFEHGISVQVSTRRETEFRGDAFPNGVRERVVSGVVTAEVRKKHNNGVPFLLTLHAANSNMFDPFGAPYF